ncbi:hypothetical protein EYC84_012142 [Monilinia fructicola]|uniref:Uncharacterized protein n=1 Tax=Monilinia fructicola TaxID=38448 RepID=A0A5M9J932_MONFR|nr:hypothetical protein EYC84_012142 [Monilinia fructicola]
MAPPKAPCCRILTARLKEQSRIRSQKKDLCIALLSPTVYLQNTPTRTPYGKKELIKAELLGIDSPDKVTKRTVKRKNPSHGIPFLYLPYPHPHSHPHQPQSDALQFPLMEVSHHPRILSVYSLPLS